MKGLHKGSLKSEKVEFMIYSIKANVFATNLGKQFGRTVHTTVIATSTDDALQQGEINMKNYCAILKKNHNNDFNFSDLTIE